MEQKRNTKHTAGSDTVRHMRYMSIENHPSDSRVQLIEADICQTLSGRMGTGGGNVPLILEIYEDTDREKILPLGRG